MVAANLQYSSGKPWAVTADIVPSESQGTVRVLLEPRGSQRLVSQTVLDLRGAKAWGVSLIPVVLYTSASVRCS